MASLVSTAGGDLGLSAYLSKVYSIPMLTAEEECSLAYDWINNKNIKSAQKLVTSYLRLVVKIAMQYRLYGLPVMDLISEGNIGLLCAVKKFNPERGFRFSTYAMWWVRAYIYEYILKSWSLVRIGTNATQKKLFYKLRNLKRIACMTGERVAEQDIKDVASDLSITESEVRDFSNMLSGDVSMDDPVGDGNSQVSDYIGGTQPNQEDLYIRNETIQANKERLKAAMRSLNDRERDVFINRRVYCKRMSLNDLGERYGISCERVRQIENQAMAKIVKFVRGGVEA